MKYQLPFSLKNQWLQLLLIVAAGVIILITASWLRDYLPASVVQDDLLETYVPLVRHQNDLNHCYDDGSLFCEKDRSYKPPFDKEYLLGFILADIPPGQDDRVSALYSCVDLKDRANGRYWVASEVTEGPNTKELCRDLGLRPYLLGYVSQHQIFDYSIPLYRCTGLNQIDTILTVTSTECATIGYSDQQQIGYIAAADRFDTTTIEQMCTAPARVTSDLRESATQPTTAPQAPLANSPLVAPESVSEVAPTATPTPAISPRPQAQVSPTVPPTPTPVITPTPPATDGELDGAWFISYLNQVLSPEDRQKFQLGIGTTNDPTYIGSLEGRPAVPRQLLCEMANAYYEETGDFSFYNSMLAVCAGDTNWSWSLQSDFPNFYTSPTPTPVVAASPTPIISSPTPTPITEVTTDQLDALCTAYETYCTQGGSAEVCAQIPLSICP